MPARMKPGTSSQSGRSSHHRAVESCSQPIPEAGRMWLSRWPRSLALVPSLIWEHSVIHVSAYSENATLALAGSHPAAPTSVRFHRGLERPGICLGPERAPQMLPLRASNPDRPPVAPPLDRHQASLLSSCRSSSHVSTSLIRHRRCLPRTKAGRPSLRFRQSKIVFLGMPM